MDPNQIIVNVLVLVASGSTAVLVGLVFRRLGDIAADVSKIRADVGQHAADLARGDEKISQLRSDVNGLIERERQRAA